ncbi:hypothetical protein ACF3NR_00485 [Vaginella massiliensis]
MTRLFILKVNFGILDSDNEIEDSGKYIPKEIKGKFVVQNVDFTFPNSFK